MKVGRDLAYTLAAQAALWIVVLGPAGGSDGRLPDNGPSLLLLHALAIVAGAASPRKGLASVLAILVALASGTSALPDAPGCSPTMGAAVLATVISLCEFGPEVPYLGAFTVAAAVLASAYFSVHVRGFLDHWFVDRQDAQ